MPLLEIAMRAPALYARGFTKAYTGMRALRTASAIRSAASILPPGVSISRNAATAPADSASRRLRATYGARPFSTTPVTGMR